MTMLKTFQRSSFAPSRSPARMRWPVEEMGRNSVRTSTIPRTDALMRVMRLDKELPYRLPECRHVVGAIVPRAGELDPPFRSLPGLEKPLRMDCGNDLVALGAEAEERGGDGGGARGGGEWSGAYSTQLGGREGLGWPQPLVWRWKGAPRTPPSPARAAASW